MSVAEIQDQVGRWQAAGHACGVATLVRVERSAPRPPGARFAVSETGETAGSISSGCVESDLYEHLSELLEGRAPRVVRYGITDEMASAVGLACGGGIEVLLAVHEPDAAWQRAVGAVTAGEPAVLLTGLSEAIRARRLLLLPDGSRIGSLGDERLDARIGDPASALFRTGGSRIFSDAESALEVFAEALLPPPRLAIVGATPVAEALSHLASYLDIAVTIVDPRPAFAREDRFPRARLVHDWPEEGLREAGLDPYLWVAIVAHDRKLDLPALQAALDAGCAYVGLLGGRRTQRLRRDALAEMGVPDDVIRRVRGPIGLDIGAVTPAEIAVSILAEILSLRGEGP